MTKDIWIVVANSSKALICAAQKKSSHLVLIEHLEHAASRLQNRDLAADKAGYRSSKGGTSSYEDKNNPKHLEAKHFAEIISKKLQEEHNHGKYSHLAICSGNGFLKFLEEKLSSNLKNCILPEGLIHHDYTEKNLAELTEIFKHFIKKAHAPIEI